jgi:hypothetical protein
MIELFFLLIIIPRRVRVLAKERNESAWKWSLAAIGAWVGAELVVGLILGVLLGLAARVGLLTGTNAILYFVIYLLLIAAAATGTTLVIRQLRKKPIIGSGSTETTQA